MERSRAEREQEIERRLGEVTSSLGYSTNVRVSRGRSDRSWTYAREGDRFATEAILFRLAWRPAPVGITVDLFGSPSSVDELEDVGDLDRLVAPRRSLFASQQVAGKAPWEILPPRIELGNEAEWDDVFRHLALELKAIEHTIWEQLWSDWQRELEMKNR